MKTRLLRRGSALAPAIFLLTACGGPPSTAVVTVSLPGAGQTGPADQGGPEEVSAAGCSWSGEALLARGDDVRLCFAKEEACFARATPFEEGHVTLTLPEGNAAKGWASIELRRQGIRIRAATAGDQVLVGPKGVLVLGGVVVPHVARRVLVDRIASGRAEISLASGDGVQALSQHLRASAACEDLTLTDPSFETPAVLEALGVRSKPLGKQSVASGYPVKIAATAGGPPLLAIALEGETPSVELIEVRGGWSRILWERDDMTIAGWVDSSLLGPDSDNPFGIGGIGLGWGSGHSSGVSCPAAIPLFAEVAGARRQVGSISAHTAFDPKGRRGEWAAVALRATHLTLEDGATWLVRGRDLDRCLTK